METAIRWSPLSSADRPNFIILDVVKSRLQFCEAKFTKGQSHEKESVVNWNVLSTRDRLPTYTAFDFSKLDPYIIGLGGDVGETTIVNLRSTSHGNVVPQNLTFGVKSQRRANTIAFSNVNYVATGLDRLSRDQGLYIYDLNASTQSSMSRPIRTLANSDGVSSVKFFNREPKTLIAGTTRNCIRLYDLRDNTTSGGLILPSPWVHNLSIDPLDENYFISAASGKDPCVAVWDKRMVKPSTTPNETSSSTSILEIRSAIAGEHNSAIYSLRFCGLKRGCFSVLSSSGEVRVFELAQHRGDLEKDSMPHNPNGGTPWISKTYTRRTHSMVYPFWHQNAARNDTKRVVACDFISSAGVTRNLSMLALKNDRTISLLEVHTQPRIMNMTSLDELYFWKNRQSHFKSKPDYDSIAENLMSLQNKASLAGDQKAFDQSMYNTSMISNLNLEGLGDNLPLQKPSSERHAELLVLNFPKYIPEIADSLELIQTYRKRCEEGYSMDISRNQRIVANDPWLHDMWDTISRLEEIADENGMFVDGIDLSFLGIYALWTGDFGLRNRREDETRTYSPNEIDDIIKEIVHRKGFPSFRGHDTQRPSTRQLCLAICRWTFSREILAARCERLMAQGQHYKAIVAAVMRGFKDLAQEVLKKSIQKKTISNIGLGAVIACEFVSDSQREMCSWMKEETEDPYLQALLAYFISGDWGSVCNMDILPLYDRLGCAIKYLDDDRLDEFIRITTQTAVVSGNIEGIVLTGINDKAIDLFEKYIKNHGDLQTSVLALSFATPVYVVDPRFDAWRDTYLLQMQTWRAFRNRTLYIAEHTKRSATRVDKRRRFAKVPARPITLRCSHCLSVLAPHTLTTSPAAPTSLPEPGPTSSLHANNPPSSSSAPSLATTGSSAATIAAAAATISTPSTLLPGQVIESTAPAAGDFSRRAAARSGVSCPRCGRPMPHCGICGLLLGTPDPAAVRSAAVSGALQAQHHRAGAGAGAGAGASSASASASRPVQPSRSGSGTATASRMLSASGNSSDRLNGLTRAGGAANGSGGHVAAVAGATTAGISGGSGVGESGGTAAAVVAERLALMNQFSEQDPIATQALYCMLCLHVFHGHHAREWFARQRVCPVPECECRCGILH